MSNLSNIAVVIGRNLKGSLECIELTEDADRAINVFKDLRAQNGGGFSHLVVYRRGSMIKRASFDAPAANVAPKAGKSKGG